MYDFFIHLYVFLLRMAAPFHPKARLWVKGRRNWRARYGADFQRRGQVLWVHVSSLGEFEQGRPLIEAFRAQYPAWQIVLTFFSPSGYEIRKNYAGADFVAYLPADTRRNAADFLDLIQPDLAVFVKYDFWANYLFALQKRAVPTMLVSALFRENQPFFRWYGALWRRMLHCFTQVFVQNEDSKKLLHRIDFQDVTIAGDTRVDRVLGIAAQAPEHAVVAAFVGVADPSNRVVFIAGSSWEADEAVFLPALLHPNTAAGIKIIIAPHEISPENIRRIEQTAGAGVLRYTQATPATARTARILLIDNIGLLNTLYRYGTLAYIGGGFGKGIHNTLEPAAFGLPVIFGPKYAKFEEARQMVQRGGAFPVHDMASLAAIVQQLRDADAYKRASQAVLGYLAESKGATAKVMGWLIDRERTTVDGGRTGFDGKK